MTYRVREALQLLCEELQRPISFVQIEPGSLIKVTGRVKVLYEGQTFGASIRDIEARADLVEDKERQ